MQRFVLSFFALLSLAVAAQAQVVTTYFVEDPNGVTIGVAEHSEPDGTLTFYDANGNATWQGKRTSPAGANPTTFADPVSGIVVIITSDGDKIRWEVFYPNGGYAWGCLTLAG